MKVYTIEVVEAIEKEFRKFLSEWGGGYEMRFTRFLDLGGQQCDLYMYPAESGSPPWMVVRVKSVFKTDQGECMQYFVSIPALDKHTDEVLVSPEVWKLPALADKVLTFAKNDLLMKINEGGATLQAGSQGGPEAPSAPLPASTSQEESQEEDIEDLDTSGILASDDDDDDDAPEEEESSFDPSDLLKSLEEVAASEDAEAEGESETEAESPPEADTEESESEEAQEKADDDSSGFNPDDAIKD